MTELRWNPTVVLFNVEQTEVIVDNQYGQEVVEEQTDVIVDNQYGQEEVVEE